MDRFEILTRLPARLSCIILHDWLKLKAVMTLDSAYCCHSHRRMFEELLQSDEFFISEKLTISSTSKVFGSLQRFGEKLRSVVFVDELTREQGKRVAKHCHNLTHVEFRSSEESCTPQLWKMLETNVKIESLKVDSGSTVDQYCPPFLFTFQNILLPKLSHFGLYGYEVLENQLTDLIQMSKNIVWLELSSCILYGVEPSSLEQMLEPYPAVKFLGLSHCECSDDIVNNVTASFPNVKHFDLEGCRNITDAALISAINNFNGLQSLNIKTVSHLTDASLVHIYTHCAATLHTIHLDCGEIGETVPNRDEALYSEDAINTLLERCTQLRTLYFGDFFEQHELDTIALSPAAIGNLTTMILGSKIISAENMTTISQYGSKLNVLAVYADCDYSEQLLLNLVNGCPNLKEVYLNLESHTKIEDDSSLIGFVLAFMALWRQLRPGLIVERIEYCWAYPKYNVMNL